MTAEIEVQIEPKTGMAPRLTKRNPAANEFRFYQLGLWPDLFGGCNLVREFGRIGQPGCLKVTHFESSNAARAALNALYRAKARRGYDLSTRTSR
ncbi:MAG: WGR domain-containing protein [Pseudomonadota bacterium]